MSQMSRYKKDIGDFGEKAAEEYLTSKGYRILERKFVTRFGEIDLVALSPQKDTVVFAEVKTRKDKRHGNAAESIDGNKLSRIVKSAQQYILSNPFESDMRFDVIEVYTEGETKLNHIENAFPDVSGFIDF